MSRDDYDPTANFISDDLLPGVYPSQNQPTPYPALNPVDDTYAGYDPGMAGCTSGHTTCAIPGMPSMGHELPRPSPSPSRDPSHPRHPPHPEWVSHGYERDADEYEDPVPSGVHPAEPLTGGGSSGPPNADPVRSAKPPIATRFVGHVERIAGKVLHDSQIQARGMRHVTGHD